MLPTSILLPGLAPDLAWCLGLPVPKECRGKDGRTQPKDLGGPIPDHDLRTHDMIRDEIQVLGKREGLP